MKTLHLLLQLSTLSLTQGLIQQGTLRILCFGDSITAGFTNHGTSRHPYAESLKFSLQTSFPDLNIITDNHGLSGDQVQFPGGSYLPRITSLCWFSSLKDAAYDFAVILGGTNDLTQGREPDVILEALQKVWNVPLSYGGNVLALTVPESGNTPQAVNLKRIGLNELILKHEEDRFFTLDLSTKVPYFSMPEDERREIWDDGTHFTPKGYDLVGTIVASHIVELVQEQGKSLQAMLNSDQSEL